MSDDRPPRDGEVPSPHVTDPLVPCPGKCGTEVRRSVAGQSHSYFARAGSTQRVVCEGH